MSLKEKRFQWIAEFYSKRLVFIPLSGEKIEQFCALYSNQQVMRYVAPVLDRKAAEQLFHKNMMNMQQSPPTGIIWCIEDIHTNEFTGLIGLNWKSGNRKKVEFGLLIRPEFHNKGIGKESLRNLLNHCETSGEIDSVYALLEPENQSMKCLLEASNFTLVENVEEASDDKYLRYHFTLNRP